MMYMPGSVDSGWMESGRRDCSRSTANMRIWPGCPWGIFMRDAREPEGTGSNMSMVSSDIFNAAMMLSLVFVFGLWRVRFPPVLVRTGRRLPVQALGERRVWVALTGYPRSGAPGP